MRRRPKTLSGHPRRSAAPIHRLGGEGPTPALRPGGGGHGFQTGRNPAAPPPHRILMRYPHLHLQSSFIYRIIPPAARSRRPTGAGAPSRLQTGQLRTLGEGWVRLPGAVSIRVSRQKATPAFAMDGAALPSRQGIALGPHAAGRGPDRPGLHLRPLEEPNRTQAAGP